MAEHYYDPMLCSCSPENPMTMGVTAVLTEQIDGKLLKEAAEELRERFAYFYVRAKIEDIHSFRHFNASVMIFKGIDVVSVSASLGHSTPATTTTIYCHEFQKANAMASEAISDVIDFSAKRESIDISGRNDKSAVERYEKILKAKIKDK